LLEQAAEKNIHIDTLSFIVTEPISDPALTRRVRELRSQSLTAIFTSMNAVEAVASLLEQQPAPSHGQSPTSFPASGHGPSSTAPPDSGQAQSSTTSPASTQGQSPTVPPAPGQGPSPTSSPDPSWKIFCIGGATRNLLQARFSASTIVGTAPDASALAGVILEHSPSEVFFFCGDQRRDALPEKLKAAGTRVHELVVYRTTETPRTVEEAYDGVVFFSPSAVNSFFSVNSLPENTTLFAIGHTTAGAIRSHVNNSVITSATPEKEALVRQMIAHFQKNI
jgi:uroporphyrinogen-III synthase